MPFNLPAVKNYGLGLIFTLLVLGIFYLLLHTLQLLTLSPMGALLVGLLLGQLIGFLVRNRATAPARQRDTQLPGSKTIYVGNLPFKTTRYELKELFQPYGKVHNVRIMIDKATRKPRGFGFVEMPNDDAAQAIAQLDGVSFIGRNLKISEANERNER